MSTTADVFAKARIHDRMEQLKTLRGLGALPFFRVLEGATRPVVEMEGRPRIMLGSNNYLGLTTHPRLRERALDATRRFGVGTGSVRTIAGTMAIHMELERRLAEFKNTEAVVVFQSGFTANAGGIRAADSEHVHIAGVRQRRPHHVQVQRALRGYYDAGRGSTRG